jgi:hypothetical protein
VDHHRQALPLCERIEQDLVGVRRALAPAQDAADHDPTLQAASAVEACRTLRRHCDDLFRAVLADALDSGVPPRLLDLPGE